MKQTLVYFFRSEPAAGVVLMLAALIGFGLANSSYAADYFAFLSVKVLGMSLLHWINDGLMAVFFLYVGLEVKREFLVGELDSGEKRLLPALAATGGLALPALIYIWFNSSGEAFNGWAVPVATDIAFALGILALLGKRVPPALKIFLTALAIIDDLAVIVLIALFYTAEVSWLYLVIGLALWLILIGLNLAAYRKHLGYIVLGSLMWLMVLKSGVHATIAGVLLALTIPLKFEDSIEEPLLLRWEHGLENWVAFLIVPVFGVANAGVSLAGLSWEVLTSGVVLGIAAGLFLGKQLGVMALVALAVRLKWARLPEDTSWLQMYGLALLCGVGFTMSLFIGMLAFAAPQWQDYAKLGVFVGSALSAVFAVVVLLSAHRRAALQGAADGV